MIPGKKTTLRMMATVIMAAMTALILSTGVDAQAPPNTQISGGGGSSGREYVPYHFFSPDAPGSTFECSMNGSAFTACTSGQNFGPLTGCGTQTFQVRAVNANGTDPTPATSVFTRTPSNTQISGANPMPNTNYGNFIFFSPDDSTGVTFECSVDNATFTSCVSGPVGPLLNGPHHFEVRAVNECGVDPTPAAYDIVVQAPNTQVSYGFTSWGSPNVTFGFISSVPGSTFECDLDSTGYVPCPSTVTFTNVQPGYHVLHVRAVDPFGQVDTTPVIWAFRDLYLFSSMEVLSAPPAVTTSGDATFTVAMEADDYSYLPHPVVSQLMRCRLGTTGSFVNCDSGTISFTSLPVGDYELQMFGCVRIDSGTAILSACQQAVTVYNWSVVAPPTVTVTGGSGSATTNPDGSTTVTATSTGGGSFGITLPPGTMPPSGGSEITIAVSSGPGNAHPSIVINAALPPGTTKSVTMPYVNRDLCINDVAGASITTQGTCSGVMVKKQDFPATGACMSWRASDTMCRAANGSSLTINGLLHTALYYVLDEDGDGVNDVEDMCLGTDLLGPIPLQTLRPNHVGDSMLLAGGCNCSQILDEMGNNGNGPRKFGCTPGIVHEWTEGVSP